MGLLAPCAFELHPPPQLATEAQEEDENAHLAEAEAALEAEREADEAAHSAEQHARAAGIAERLRETDTAQLDSLLTKTAMYADFIGQSIMERTEERGGVSTRAQAAASPEAKRRRVAAPAKAKRKGKSKAEVEAERASATAASKARLEDAARAGEAHAFRPSAGFVQPALLEGVELREYQKAGVEWLISLYENGVSGILADEMGLGKTVQTIGVLAYMRDKNMWGPVVVVAPLSTLQNWVNEFARFAPQIPVVLYHGSKDERLEKWAAVQRKMRSKDNSATPVVVTSYEVVLRDEKALQKPLWKYVIVDEGHRLKNRECRLFNSMRQMKSENRLLLTGTPLQNDLPELWALLNFILPDVFDNVDIFKQWFEFSTLIVDGESAAHSGEIMRREQEDHFVSKLHQILRPFLLRRVKTEVETELPKKREFILYVQLSPFQRQFQDAIGNKTLADLLGKERKTLSLQNLLMQLRKVANHPYMFDWPTVEGSDYRVVDESLVERSSKMVLLDRILALLKREGHKAVIFSQFTSMLDLIDAYCDMRGYSWSRIDGTTPHEDRQRLMDEFNGDPNRFLFLASTRAGGLGINLTSADTVILFDSDWNPHADSQAAARVHRIGQRRKVRVFRLASVNSAETKMLKRAEGKMKLDKLIISKGAFSASRTAKAAKSFTAEDLQELLADKGSGVDESILGQVISDADLHRLISRTGDPSSEGEHLAGPGFEEVGDKPKQNKLL